MKWKTNPIGKALTDFLTDIARKERRNLLFASTVGIFIAHLGLVPSKVSALGVDFNAPEQSSFLVLVALTVTYFVGAFAIYGLADYFIWRTRYHDYEIAAEMEGMNWTPDDQEEHDLVQSFAPRIDWLHRLVPKLIYTRVSFDFLLPIVVGLYAVTALVVRGVCA